mmetsp:Transcript_2276/g.2755  ORF Transcript_2276/g.2755 Transcript_2276/m.2755 type:complete len:778 (+) Transcript_2276:162-2495(+)
MIYDRRALSIVLALFCITSNERTNVFGFTPPFPIEQRILSLRPSPSSTKSSSILHVSQLEKEKTSMKKKRKRIKDSKIPEGLRTTGRGITKRNDPTQMVDASSYESQLLKKWDTAADGRGQVQSGFDWEIEKARRYFAGLRLREDGTWVKKPSMFDFLVIKGRATSVGTTTNKNKISRPKPVTSMDVVALVGTNLLASLGMRTTLGMADVPTAIIQKYEGSMLSFIKGALGGDLQTLAGGPLFLLLAKYCEVHGPIYNLAFGPKSFLVVSDPVMAKRILKEASPDQYCKGMLAEILEPIMGKGLIPADPVTWKVRRRAVAPGFHKKWLKQMVGLFADRADILIDDLQKRSSAVVDMEERFCSVTLDIIGKSVFNYDFGSVNEESPIVKAVYRVLREAEHRSSSFIPYWNLPYADQWMGGQVEFRRDMTMLDDILCDLINDAIQTRSEASIEELEERENEENPSLLRFLVDMRGEDLSSSVLRDDLMTMLIAGHETTAAVLTWTLYELANGDPEMLSEVQAEVRTILMDKSRPDFDDVPKFKKLRLCLVEALRLYPEPPVLIRRARTQDKLPSGGSGLGDIKVLRGTDIFVSTWNLHRSPDLWETPEKYDPTRWERKFTNKNIEGWAGFDPDKCSGLYPNEIATDFAYLPFGGGQRKCVGDQFAMTEAIVTMSMILNNFDFTFATCAEDVGMKTGATIHTMNGLNMNVRPLDLSIPPPETNGWWERQHTSRGLDSNGRAIKTTATVAATTTTEQDIISESPVKLHIQQQIGEEHPRKP